MTPPPAPTEICRRGGGGGGGGGEGGGGAVRSGLHVAVSPPTSRHVATAPDTGHLTQNPCRPRVGPVSSRSASSPCRLGTGRHGLIGWQHGVIDWQHGLIGTGLFLGAIFPACHIFLDMNHLAMSCHTTTCLVDLKRLRRVLGTDLPTFVSDRSRVLKDR